MIKTRRLSLAAVTFLATLFSTGNISFAAPQPAESTSISESESQTIPNERSTAPSPGSSLISEEDLAKLNTRLQDLEERQAADNKFFLPIPLLAGGALLVGLLGLAAGISAHIQLRRSHLSLRRQNESLRGRLDNLELQIEQDRVLNRTRFTNQQPIQQGLGTTPLTDRAAPAFTVTALEPTPVVSPAAPVVAAAEPIQPKPPALVSKAGLIAALNNGDRQQLRDASKAELNITSESENAIATGRAMETELEEVPGGGSYWLVALDGQHWLFPTDRTLKGFAAAQPAKGLFQYEQQTIAQPRLIEPARLEHTGSAWCVRTQGRIGIP